MRRASVGTVLRRGLLHFYCTVQMYVGLASTRDEGERLVQRQVFLWTSEWEDGKEAGVLDMLQYGTGSYVYMHL